jgi:hypothetical protein
MTNPDTIANEIVTRLLAIPLLVSALPNGIAYHTEVLGTREKAVDSMRDNSALLTWDGMVAATDGDGQVYQHDFRLYVRANANSFGTVLLRLHDGVPTVGDGMKMIYTNIPSVAERIELASALPVVGKDNADYLEIYFTILDRQG